MTGRHATTFCDGLTFGEAPRWHDGRLWYSDFFDHAVWSVADDGSQHRREVHVPGQPSGLGWLPDGRLLVVSMLDRTVQRREADGRMVLHAELGRWATFHANDMLVDDRGRAYVGNFGFDLDAFLAGHAEACATSLVRVDPDGTTTEAARDLRFPNGVVVLGDSTLVVAETFGGRLTAFDVGQEGELSGRREWARLYGCAPDGTCGDAEGAIWVANAVAPECLRVAEGGEVLDRVVTSQPCFACVLGGDDRRTLFCMTAPTSVAKELAGKRLGRIERVPVTVPGAGLP